MTHVLSTEAARKTLQWRTTTALRVVVAVSIAAACILAFAQARADEPGTAQAVAGEPVAADLDALERVFWVCDRAATLYGVNGVDGMACANATEQLKLHKFSGDFDAMLAWWQDNKAAMHMQIGQAQTAAAATGAEDAEIFPQP